MDKYGPLKQYFGHSGFRPGQEELVLQLDLDRLPTYGVMRDTDRRTRGCWRRCGRCAAGWPRPAACPPTWSFPTPR